MSSKRVLIVGGVAGGASCAARLRRMDEYAEIFVFERGGDVSFANCGLPYYIGDVITEREHAAGGHARAVPRFASTSKFARGMKCASIDRQKRTIEVLNLPDGRRQREPYDTLVLATGAEPMRPPLPGIDLPGIFTLRNLDDVEGIRAGSTTAESLGRSWSAAATSGWRWSRTSAGARINVTLVELTNQVMPPVDPEMVAPFTRNCVGKGSICDWASRWRRSSRGRTIRLSW